MNDKGKTVSSISNVTSGYASKAARGVHPRERWVEIKLRMNLAHGFPGQSGFGPTMRAISTVTDRTINALNREFLP